MAGERPKKSSDSKNSKNKAEGLMDVGEENHREKEKEAREEEIEEPGRMRKEREMERGMGRPAT